LLAVLAAMAVVYGGFLFTCWVAARIALPRQDGKLSVAGLSAPVTVVRDAQGVPHVRAATVEDLFFAQGFVTAQDRLWQMDMTRRFAAGELSEVLGAGYLPHDRRQRTLLIRMAAEQAAVQLSPRDRAHFEAYARGVNALIARQPLPLEFRLLRYRPRPWTVTDSMLVATSMAQMLSLGTVAHELSRQELSSRLSPELAADLYPNSSWRDHPPAAPPSWEELQRPADEEDSRRPPAPAHHRGRHRAASAAPPLSLSAVLAALAGRLPRQPMPSADGPELIPGSNNWVLSGAHTVSGKPLLANDMHLPHQMPNVWYEAHLTSGDYDVAGVTLPGLPYVVAGHNGHIAWGFTNLAPAVTDLFVETFNERGEYQTPQGWRQPERRHEVIRVRRGMVLNLYRDEPLDVIITRHGPLVTRQMLAGDDSGGQKSAPNPAQRLALKWTIYDPQTMQVPFFDLNLARNWEEFRQALRRLGNPAQNVVYADADGHIGYQAAGMVPLRTAGTGGLPAPGNDDSHEWTGYLPFEQLPSLFDPPAGVIATANGRITPDDFPLTISDEWGPPYRTERIYRVLETDRKFAAADMLTLQMDVYSDFDRFCAQRFVYAVDHTPSAPARVHQAAEILRAWDGRVNVNSAAATITARARQELVRLLLAPKLGDTRKDYRWAMQAVWLENVLLLQPDRWLPPGYANWEEALSAAVRAAVAAPDAPRDLNGWPWGQQTEQDVRHPIFGRIPGLSYWASAGRMAQSGNGYTVKQVGPLFGPSERMTVDFGNLDGSTLNLVNGQSGQLFSPHFNDQWRSWYQGTSFPLPFSESAVGAARRHTLTLQPK
jgi:penicillin amidase